MQIDAGAEAGCDITGQEIRVKVVDPLGNVIPWALVIVAQEASRESKRTSIEGCAVFRWLPVGPPVIYISAEGYAPHVRYGDMLREQEITLVPTSAGIFEESGFQTVVTRVSVPEELRPPESWFSVQPITNAFYRDGLHGWPSADPSMDRRGVYDWEDLTLRVDVRAWLGLATVVASDVQHTDLLTWTYLPLPPGEERLIVQPLEPDRPTTRTVRLAIDPAVPDAFGATHRVEPLLVLDEGGYLRLKAEDMGIIRAAPQPSIETVEFPDLERWGASAAASLESKWIRSVPGDPSLYEQISRRLVPVDVDAEDWAVAPEDFGAGLGPIAVTYDRDGLHVERLRPSSEPEQCRFRLVGGDLATETLAVVEDFSGARDLPVFDFAWAGGSAWLAAECRRFSGWSPESGEPRESFVDAHLQLRERLPVEVPAFRP